jgi:hypothetical protein
MLGFPGSKFRRGRFATDSKSRDLVVESCIIETVRVTMVEENPRCFWPTLTLTGQNICSKIMKSTL